MPNIWTAFSALIPKSRTIVVLVQIVNADGTSNVTDPAGNVLRVLGDSVPEGQSAFVQDGRIIEAAPTLPSYDVEV